MATILERRHGIERAAHAHGDAFARRFDGAGGNDRVLAGERRGQQLRRDAQPRHLPQRQVDVDDFVLHADEIHLADVAHAQQLGADELGLVAQLAIGEAVAGQRVDHAIHVAEVVVEKRARRRLAASWPRMSPNFLRTWYHWSGTAFGGVLSRRLTMIVASPGLV